MNHWLIIATVTHYLNPASTSSTMVQTGIEVKLTTHDCQWWPWSTWSLTGPRTGQMAVLKNSWIKGPNPLYSLKQKHYFAVMKWETSLWSLLEKKLSQNTPISHAPHKLKLHVLTISKSFTGVLHSAVKCSHSTHSLLSQDSTPENIVWILKFSHSLNYWSKVMINKHYCKYILCWQQTGYQDKSPSGLRASRPQDISPPSQGGMLQLWKSMGCPLLLEK